MKRVWTDVLYTPRKNVLLYSNTCIKSKLKRSMTDQVWVPIAAVVGQLNFNSFLEVQVHQLKVE